MIQSAGPKKEQLADVAKEAAGGVRDRSADVADTVELRAVTDTVSCADLELETEKLKQTFARAEDEQSFHLVTT